MGLNHIILNTLCSEPLSRVPPAGGETMPSVVEQLPTLPQMIDAASKQLPAPLNVVENSPSGPKAAPDAATQVNPKHVYCMCFRGVERESMGDTGYAAKLKRGKHKTICNWRKFLSGYYPSGSVSHVQASPHFIGSREPKSTKYLLHVPVGKHANQVHLSICFTGQ